MRPCHFSYFKASRILVATADDSKSQMDPRKRGQSSSPSHDNFFVFSIYCLRASASICVVRVAAADNIVALVRNRFVTRRKRESKIHRIAVLKLVLNAPQWINTSWKRCGRHVANDSDYDIGYVLPIAKSCRHDWSVRTLHRPIQPKVTAQVRHFCYLLS